MPFLAVFVFQGGELSAIPRRRALLLQRQSVSSGAQERRAPPRPPRRSGSNRNRRGLTLAAPEGSPGIAKPFAAQRQDLRSAAGSRAAFARCRNSQRDLTNQDFR